MESISRGRRGADGRTAYELRRGRPCRAPLVFFGERGLCLPRNRRPSRLASGPVDGIFLALKDNTNEYLCYAPDWKRIIAAQSLRRLSPEERCNADMFNQIEGTPWCLNVHASPDAPVRQPISMSADPVVPREELPPASSRQFARRRLYITPAILDKYGRTDGCPGCLAGTLGR